MTLLICEKVIGLPPKKRFSLLKSLVARLEVIRPYMTSSPSSTPSLVAVENRVLLQLLRSQMFSSLSSVNSFLSDPDEFFSFILTFMVVEGEDVVGTSGYHCGVLRSFPLKRIEQGIGSKILPCGDGSCYNAFKPIASLIAVCTNGIDGGHDLEEKDVNVILDHYRD
ncbi:hypothetical protein Tco_0277116 [Tanacetum coccineum]